MARGTGRASTQPRDVGGGWREVIGAERNTLWACIDDGSRAGYAEVRRQEDRVLGPGDVLTLQPDSIHSVINDTTSVTIHSPCTAST